MRPLIASVILIVVSASDVQGFAAVAREKCETGIWHFATSYYTTFEQRARDDCERYNCDLIVEWTRRVKNGAKKFYDIGMFEGEICKQFVVDSAKVIWQKPRNTITSGSNFTATGTHFCNCYLQLLS